MESPLWVAVGAVERKSSASKMDTSIGITGIGSSNFDKMNSSINSPLEDTTPSDSGVQLLDSDTSELMVESITSQNGFDFEECKPTNAGPLVTEQIQTHFRSQIQEIRPIQVEQLQQAEEPIDTNSNVMTSAPTTTSTACDDVMTVSACSTFEATDNIVFRRKVRKTPITAAAKAPKKRVSFHEDILKNTRTDNIHIEHGFITYKNGRKMPANSGAGRYSWCSEGQGACGSAAGNPRHADLCSRTSPDDEEAGVDGSDDGSHRRGRRVVYRNACSDVLDYGNSDVYDTNEPNYLQYDNSGVFEYLPKQRDERNKDNSADNAELYRCSCSSSNSSLDSDENNDKNSNRQEKQSTYAGGQGKSSSCDCVLGNMSSANNNLIGDNCYFSEPNIDNLNDGAVAFKKSVWNKEKKPKSSCLKKTKRHTDVIQEQDLSTKMKKFNVHDMNQLIDNSSKMLFGSLKSFFTMPLPERGVPEGSEDLQSVVECLSELEQTPEHRSEFDKNVSKAKQNVVASVSPTSPVLKSKPFLSKSLDGSKAQQNAKQFVHNVDEQLRRKNNEQLIAPTRESSAGISITSKAPLQRQTEIEYDSNQSAPQTTLATAMSPPTTSSSIQFRNKFIINCESTVFEHTGVSYEEQKIFATTIESTIHSNVDDEALAVSAAFDDDVVHVDSSVTDNISNTTPIAHPEPDQLRSAFYAAPIAKTFSNFFRSFKEVTTSTPNTEIQKRQKEQLQQRKWDAKQTEDYERQRQLKAADNYLAQKMPAKTEPPTSLSSLSSTAFNTKQVLKSTLPSAISSSTISSELSATSSTSSSAHGQLNKQQAQQQQQQKFNASIGGCNSLVLGQELRSNLEKQSRHLASPLKKRSSGSNLLLQPQRYGHSNSNTSVGQLSPEIFNSNNTSYNLARGGCGRDSKSTILSEFDDILTITTDTDRNESDIVIVDYPSELNDAAAMKEATNAPSATGFDYSNLLKPPAAKTSLINRFLRNVTQKKILETSMRRNNFFASKLKSEQKLLSGQLYVRGVRGPKNYDLIEDLNAEIAMEIEMSGANSPRRELTSINSTDLPGDVSRFELGIGEISIDIFNGNYLHILRDSSEQLMKVFKLYTGYTREGYMTPVLVFLTDKTLYVTDLVRNRLCTKFVLAYVDLDVILLGPSGNTVLLSNSARDMQQVLLAGGPYPAHGLVANLELCARRSGSTLPAVGQLTLAHLAPLRGFVRQHTCVGRNDAWMYYAVVNVPAARTLGTNALVGGETEPLGPNVKGFLMHRRVKDNFMSHNNASSVKQSWNPGYFLLKAGVLYMFNDSMQKLPSWAMALAECQGARRAVKAGRPHCFEIMLRGNELLQMAAPDEYVASEWLQALLQSASGLFELQEKHKTLGCTLVVTENHLLTLREDFSAPLRQMNRVPLNKMNIPLDNRQMMEMMAPASGGDTGSVLSSAKSTPTKCAQRSNSSLNSTPTKLSQLSRSTTATTTSLCNTLTSPSASTSNATNQCGQLAEQSVATCDESYSNMSSVYGKNSGLEILSCADIKEMTGIKIPSHNDTWWCILDFSCQEVRESSDDLVIFFASSTEMQRFLRLLEQLWQAKNNDLFPITVLDEDDLVAEQCTKLYMDINRAWEPLLSAALGYPL